MGAALPIIGLVGGFASNIMGGFSEASQANAQSQIARNNAQIAGQNAAYAGQVGEIKAESQGLKTRGEVGQIKANQAASGVDVNSGSAVDVRRSASQIGMQDAMTIKSNAARQAYGYQLEQQQNTTQSKLYRSQAKAAPWKGLISGAGSLLSGATSYSREFGFGGSSGGSASWGSGDASWAGG